MKKIFTLLVCLFLANLSAQQKVAQRVAELKQAKSVFRPFTILDATSQTQDAEIAKGVSKASFAKIRTTQVNAIASGDFETIEVAVPYLGDNLQLELYKVEPFNENFHIETDKGGFADYKKGAYYRGIVKNDPHSLVALSFFDNEFSGIISADAIGNLNVGKIHKAGNTEDYIIYSDADLTMTNPFSCGMKIDVEDPGFQDNGNATDRAALSTRCVTVYFEIDYDIYQQNGSSVTTTVNWMTGIFNNVASLYANDGITVALRSTYVWTTPDPYTGDSSADYLYQFNSVRPVFDGDVGMLVGIDPGGLGGVAVTINGLCSGNNFSYSDVNFSYSNIPTFSWTVEVVTHELGHLLGSPHTHGCYWNGNNTAIDGCGTQAGYVEGNCAMGPIPSSTVKGTIMSYCHLISGVGISFSNGFGPQPAARILTAVNNGSCLSTDCINTCINTVADITADNVTTSSATIHWTELGSQSNWQVLVLPFANNFGFYTTVSSPTYSSSGLAPNSFYKARVRPICTGVTAASRQTIFATAADWCSGVTITDTGGTTGDYTDEQNYVRVMIPTLPNKKIELNITQFDLETDYDYLYIYDGASTAAPDLTNGGMTGENLSGPFPPFVSSSPDGALTLRFFSDQGVVESGYTATVGCQDLLGVNGVKPNIDFTYYPNPTHDAVNIVSQTEISSIEVYNVAGQLLYSGKTNVMEAKVDLSAFATGTYFFKLKFGEIGANFKIMKY